MNLASLQNIEMQNKSNHSTEPYWQVPLKASPLSQIKTLLSSVSQQQLKLLWRQLLGGGLQATSSNQSCVTLEQLLLWVNNSRSRTFLAFIMELSVFKLAKSAGGNSTQWQWPIVDSFYSENSTLFSRQELSPCIPLSFPFLANIRMPFSAPLEVGVWMWQNNMCGNYIYTISKDLWKRYQMSIFK